ncbi:hypothetical protein ES703_99076 [subsurface metagenome]
MKRKITVNPDSGFAYIPKDIVSQGLSGKLDAYANAVTLTIVNPDTPLEDVVSSMQIVIQDLILRKALNEKKRKKKAGIVTAPRLS